ncbi:MAG: hypothetical protein MJ131_10230 [Lachnospiraceae bacterium]|nr:hypothetical protein [Lachnospiraceae bacterium]
MDIDSEKEQEELKLAYEADRERRKSGKEDELKAAQDYLAVLLAEIENKNAELEARQEETEILAEKLDEIERERAQDRNAVADNREKAKKSSFWMMVAVVEGLAIVALLVCSIIMYSGLKSDYEELEAQASKPTIVTPVTPSGTTETSNKPAEQAQTARYVNDLATLAAGIDKRTLGSFNCAVESIDGLEYLVFDNGDIRICYKNEYYLNDKVFRKAIMVERGEKRNVQCFNYNLNAEPKTLVPRQCSIDSKKYYVLTDYIAPGRIPETMRVIDAGTLNEYNGDNLKSKINELMTIGFSEEGTGLSYAPRLLDMKTSKASYRFGIDEVEYNEIIYNEYELPDIDSWFSMEIGDEGINWKTVVKAGSKYYLGELSGSVAFSTDSIYVNGAKFGAYAPANQEDPELNNVIIPTEVIPEKYLTVLGRESERYYIAYNDNVEECSYDWNRLNTENPNDWKYCDETGKELSIRGIDVSKYQADVDWKKVADEGVKFAIVRMGFRGMNEGTLEVDPYFTKNVEGATAAGIDVGVYFFSQAVNEKEALEEADFVLDAIKDYKITYPVIFDTERVTSFDARANNISYAQRTANTKAFCDRVAEKGYKPMIYANTKYMLMGIDLEQLADYDKWFAVYSDKITFPYNFQMLQYSESGSIPGVTGNVDLNISFVDYAKKEAKN